jgi:hypothetical protein
VRAPRSAAHAAARGFTRLALAPATDHAAEQEEEVCALQAILMDDIEGAPPPALRGPLRCCAAPFAGA